MRHRGAHRTGFVLQGGGALGAYQAGAACQLAEADILPDLVAGISIGAINAALIAGNPPERRLERLTAFWERVSGASAWPGIWPFGWEIALVAGAPGFFVPRMPPAALDATGLPGHAGVYDTSPLRRTLEELVDFDRLNDGSVRLMAGSVSVATGNFVWFDSAERRIRPEHIMASGALPPGFPPIEIDGDYYWDGGLVMNTPLARMIETRADARPLVIWQLDLFSARGPVPHSIWMVEAREKDIRFSSRTRAVTDRIRTEHALATALHAHVDALPPVFKADPAVARLLAPPACAPLTLIHLIYRAKPYETGAKDYDFSREAMRAHWAAGAADVTRSLSNPRLSTHDPFEPGMHVFDVADTQEKDLLHDRG
jgi:NTE family protein